MIVALLGAAIAAGVPIPPPPAPKHTQVVTGAFLCIGAMAADGHTVSLSVIVSGDEYRATLAVKPVKGTAWPEQEFVVKNLDGIVRVRDDHSLNYWATSSISLGAKPYAIVISFPLTTPSKDKPQFEFADSDKVQKFIRSPTDRERTMTTLQCSEQAEGQVPS